MPFYRRLLLHLVRSTAGETPTSAKLQPAVLFFTSRHFAFSSLEEAAAERRRRKRQLRIEPPTHRDSGAPRPTRNSNSPRLPDATSSLVGPRLSLHNRVQTLIRAGDLDAASAQARHAVFSPIKPTVFTCNAVISSMQRARRFDDVFALFHFFFAQQNIIPNIVSYNILINAHCDAGQVNTALDVYHHILLNAPFTASTYTYRYLIKGLVDSSRIADAVSLLREMLNRGHSADTLVYDTVIAGFIELNDMEKAIELFDELRERCLVYDGVVHATLMKGYWNLGMDKEAMECYQSLLDRQFRMHPATCNVLLETLLQHDKVTDAEQLFDQMLDEHKPPVFMGINAETYNIMINHCFKKGKFAEAIEVFNNTGLKPLPKDLGRYKYIIGMLCENGMIQDAVNLFEEMLSQAIEPDAATYGFIVDGYFRDGRIENAMVFVDKLLSGGEASLKAAVEICNKMVDELVKAGCMGQAMEVFRKIGVSNTRANAATYHVLITGLCKVRDFDGARALLEEMVNCGILVSIELQSFVSESFEKAGRSAEVELLLASSAAASPQATSAQCLEGKFVPRASSPQVSGGIFAPLANLQATA
ncbi:hypothetical protein M5K25_010892 [Dendrobium thyrsiflorum]|uniref:Pentatricopeptide repeat-containing protein n=1 Tax=Dendrobium thyrsiflorum TaxID=117978 RepID=A0ABD0V8B3_DENTH